MFEVLRTTRYNLLEPIGTGEGMNSQVFRAFDPYLERVIAVKEVEKTKLGNDFTEYCNEVRTMFEATHPNIIKIEYVCETPELICFALPYFPKGSLKARIKHGPLASRAFLKMAQGTLNGAARIHSLRFVHLDFKPANILFNDNEVPLIADFGHSRRIGSGGVVRFPAVYKWIMPPEMWTSHVATFESDIYQIGALLYRAVNGEPVYQQQKSAIGDDAGLRKEILRGRFPDLRFFLPHVPKRVRTIIRKAMRVNPTERYNSASDFAANLGRVSIPLNWEVTSLGGGAYSWHASRKGTPDLEVELRQHATSKWQTMVWTTWGTERRAKGKADYWGAGFEYGEACGHLTEVFADLGG